MTCLFTPHRPARHRTLLEGLERKRVPSRRDPQGDPQGERRVSSPAQDLYSVQASGIRVPEQTVWLRGAAEQVNRRREGCCRHLDEFQTILRSLV